MRRNDVFFALRDWELNVETIEKCCKYGFEIFMSEGFLESLRDGLKIEKTYKNFGGEEVQWKSFEMLWEMAG